MKYLDHYLPLKKTTRLYIEYAEFSSNFSHLDENRIFALMNSKEGKIRESFYEEYIQNYKKEYFFGCSYHIYESTYLKRLKTYILEYSESNELDFIKEELKVGILNHKFINFSSDFENHDINESLKKIKTKIFYSLRKRFEFLKARAATFGYELSMDKSDEIDNYKLNSITENAKKVYDYIKIGVLIAQDKIRYNKKKYEYEYLGETYSKTDFEKKLSKDLGIKSVRQYLDSTYIGELSDSKNLLKYRTKIDAIIKHCDSNNIKITEKYRLLQETIE